MVDNLDQAAVYNHTASSQTKEHSAEEQKVNLVDLPAEDVIGLFDKMEARQVELERQNSDLRLMYADFFDLSPVGYFVLNKNGLVLAANSAVAKLLNMARKDLLEHPFSSFVAKADQSLFDTHCHRVRETKDRQTCELRLMGSDGNPFFVRLESVAVTDGPQAASGQLSTVVMDIGEQMQAEAEHEHLQAAENTQLQQAKTLGEVLLALTSQTSYKAILDEILGQLRTVVSYSAANIMLLHEGVLRIARWQGYDSYGSDELLSTLEQPLAEYPIDAGVIRSQQTVVIPDTHDTTAWVALAGSEWIRSFVAVPVCSNDQVLGLLRLDSDLPHMFSQQDVERLKPFASAVAIALTHARMYGQSRHELAKRNVQAETEIIQLNRKLLTLQYAGTTITSSSDLRYVLSTVTKEMAEMLNTTGSALYEWDQRHKKVTRMARFGLDRQWENGLIADDYKVADFHLIQRVLVERRPQQITVSHPGVYPAELALMQRASLKSLLMVPMEFQDRVIGFVKVIDTSRERTFSNMEIGLVQLLGNQVANAIENTRLYEQVQLQLSERVEIEKDLRQVAARQQAILNAIPDSLLYFSQSGKLLSYKMADNYQPLGILEKTVVTRTGSRSSSTNLVDLIQHHLRQVLGSGNMHTIQCRLHLPEGPQQFEIRLIRSGPQEVLAMVRNITKH